MAITALGVGAIIGGVLTTVIEATPACPAEPRQADPVTGAPYRIERIDDENLQLCASFDIAPRSGTERYCGQRVFDPQGCMVMNLPKSSYAPGG